MTPHSTAWLIYGTFLLFWWVAAIMLFIRSRDPKWHPAALDQFERYLGVRLSARGYARLILVAAIFGTLGATWLLHFHF